MLNKLWLKFRAITVIKMRHTFCRNVMPNFTKGSKQRALAVLLFCCFFGIFKGMGLTQFQEVCSTVKQDLIAPGIKNSLT
jgi:hypothetical protein